MLPDLLNLAGFRVLHVEINTVDRVEPALTLNKS
jgi:hypothetical protein